MTTDTKRPADPGDQPPVSTVESDEAQDREQAAWSRELLLGHLPDPHRRRWQPLRAGVLNIYLFQDERFPFADGRLLLRGANATGKSRVLAFLLPFLLDGNLHPTRLEPDRDATRQVAWNLLMGEHRDRLGYTWLELGRLDDELGPQTLTLGCGLRAVKDRGIVEHWFFLTPQRIDRDLHLVTQQRTALTKRQLAEALGESSQLIERVGEYQRAVDDALFRLGDRYLPLIDLLLQLRQPQLAKKLDLDHLESALRESLPPVSGGLMANAADAFRSLDADRRQLQSSRDALSQTATFLTPYRQHVRSGMRRAAERVRTANSQFEHSSRHIRDNTQNIERLTMSRKEAAADAERVENRLQAAETRIHTLEQSDEARAASRLDDKRQNLETAQKNVERLERALHNVDEQHQQHARRVRDDQQHVGDAREYVARQVREAAARELPEELIRQHQHLLSDMSTREHVTKDETQRALATLNTETLRWQRYAQRLEALSAEILLQRRTCHDAHKTLESREADHLEATRQQSEQAERVAQTRNAQWEDLVRWHRASGTLQSEFPSLEPLEAAWFDWAERTSGPDPLAVAVDQTRRRLLDRIATDEADALHRRKLLRHERDQWQQQLDELEAGGELAPEPPATRDAKARQGRAGAPLWRIVDFAPTVPAAEHAGWEAALQASGLLDAWVQPDGRLQDAELLDTILVASDGSPLVSERQLARVLVVSGDMSETGVAAETANAVLQRIGVGLDAGRIWVDRSGRWRNGPLGGRWEKEDAQYVGAAARLRNRQRQIACLNVYLQTVEQQERALETQIDQLESRRKQLDEECRHMPSSDGLRDALAQLEGIERQVADAARRRREAAEIEQRERTALKEGIANRDRDAADMGLVAWIERCDELLRQLERYTQELRLLARLLEELSNSLGRLLQSREASQTAARGLDMARHNLRAGQMEAGQLAVQLQTLEETIGTAAVEITQKLADARVEVVRHKQDLRDLQQEDAEVAAKLAVAQSQLEQQRQDVELHDRGRRDAVEALQRHGERGLLEIADIGVDSPEFPWSLTQGVDVARAVERNSQQVRYDDDSWSRSQSRIHALREELRSHLSAQSISPEPEFLSDGLQLIHTPFRGTVLRIDQLVKQLDDEVRSHEQVLSEKERRIFEDFLLGEVGSELHRRMHEASELVGQMNGEVARRPMSTGMQMRFRWDLAEDAAVDLKDARDVLMRTQETWSTEERESLIRFLQRRIEAERVRDEAASRQEQLRAALDYRQWHALRIERRSGPDQPWRRLTRRTYGAGSGGEKAIALTVPQLAAAAAYYGSADKHAPRFILLDEAFAGISADNRSSCMELLVSFDLDVIMTSENERGCYPTIPALVICRLSRVPDLPVVLNEVFVWNGTQQQGPAAQVETFVAQDATRTDQGKPDHEDSKPARRSDERLLF